MILLFIFLLCSPAQAQDYGVHGAIFEIEERDLLKDMLQKLKNLEKEGTLKIHAEELEKRVLHLRPVSGMTKATKKREFFYDPSITVSSDIRDHRGTLMHKKGTKLNPLKYISLKQPLVFIDGEDAKQVKWARRQKSKIILLSGNPFKLMKDCPVYFDQFGTLTKKLAIKHVPSIVTQEGLKLK
ncbi:MAG: type-F conjugative transfer system protein TraW, partial [Alphaproteobacteria bacterium]|nr:type-F conjugative transfer system protein TraW [Alphaproteobacteria bacterium]